MTLGLRRVLRSTCVVHFIKLETARTAARPRGGSMLNLGRKPLLPAVVIGLCLASFATGAIGAEATTPRLRR